MKTFTVVPITTIHASRTDDHPTTDKDPAIDEDPTTVEKSERGNILVLGLTLWLVACLLLMGTISIALLSMERRELIAAADAIALEIADDIDDEAYYTGAAEAPPSSAHVRERAAQLLDQGTRVVQPTGLVGGVVVDIPGEIYPLDIRWAPPARGFEALGVVGQGTGVRREFLSHVSATVRRALVEIPEGDVLVFAPGVRKRMRDLVLRLEITSLFQSK